MGTPSERSRSEWCSTSSRRRSITSPTARRAQHPQGNSRRYKQDIILDGGWGTRIDSPKTIAHVATLRGIYVNHWLARRLAESDDIPSSPAAISAAFDGERRRVDARVKRLTRSRNAAIHGGPLSEAACGTITDCAVTLAQEALKYHDLGHRHRPATRCLHHKPPR
jgi:hypothetical protein